MESEKLKDARNQFAVKAVADENRGMRTAKIDVQGSTHWCQKQNILAHRRPSPKRKSDSSFFGNRFKSPGETQYPKEGPHHPRSNGQHESAGRTRKR